MQTVVVENNFCPFAAAVLPGDVLRVVIQSEKSVSAVLNQLVEECDCLDSQPQVETVLLVMNQDFNDFDDFLAASEYATALMDEMGYSGVYQLATFHPDYVFAGSSEDDPANYTNRSPFPMWHLLRETSIEKALENYPHPETIPDNNIKRCRQLGVRTFQQALKRCRLNQ